MFPESAKPTAAAAGAHEQRHQDGRQAHAGGAAARRTGQRLLPAKSGDLGLRRHAQEAERPEHGREDHRPDAEGGQGFRSEPRDERSVDQASERFGQQGAEYRQALRQHCQVRTRHEGMDLLQAPFLQGPRTSCENDSRCMPGILYLHGFCSSAKSAKGVFLAERFAEIGVPVTVPELDCGDFRNTTLTQQLALVSRLTAELRPDLLIGSSLGGYLAALHAARAPERVPLSVLLAPAFDFGNQLGRALGAATRTVANPGPARVLPLPNAAQRGPGVGLPRGRPALRTVPRRAYRDPNLARPARRGRSSQAVGAVRPGADERRLGTARH